VMDKMHYPRGLIRYDTLNGMEQHLDRKSEWARVFRPRVMVYTGVLVLIVSALFVGLVTRPAVRVDVVRDRGVLSRQVEDGWVENVYRLQVMNATEQMQSVRVGASGLPGMQLVPVPALTLAGAEARWVPVAVRIPPEAAAQAGAGSHVIQFDIVVAGEAPLTEKSTFMVPR
jgi:polyferredoxin